MMRRVLLVDDEPHVSRVIKIALDRKGYEVEMARNGEEALTPSVPGRSMSSSPTIRCRRWTVGGYVRPLPPTHPIRHR